jgi:hypothetical protein
MTATQRSPSAVLLRHYDTYVNGAVSFLTIEQESLKSARGVG